MKRLAYIFACLVLSLSIFGCSASDSSSRDLSVIPGQNAPSATEVENAWNMFAASHNFDQLEHLVTFGSMYNGGHYTADMAALGADINDYLDYNTTIQDQGAGVMFCEFTGDGCGPGTKK